MSPGASGSPTEAGFYDRPVLEVARDLVGCVLCHGATSGRIVETEAYHVSEPACHAYVGITPRTRVLYGAPGTLYVYRSYGIHALLNAVVEPEGVGAAVLIRALEPLDGIDRMRARRGLDREQDLCSGPGKLTQALGIDTDLNATVIGEHVDVLPRAGDQPPPAIVTGGRIGITRAIDLPWRFCDSSSRCVSKPWAEGMAVKARRVAPGEPALAKK